MPDRRERTLHLIDIENLTGSSSPTPEEVRDCRYLYETTLIETAIDLVVIACSHHAFPAVAWEWPGARQIVRSGENGADCALLDVIALEGVAERFDSVVVGSGDRIFTDAVARLGAAGVDVTVISRPESLSRRLRLATSRLVLLPTLLADVRLPRDAA